MQVQNTQTSTATRTSK